MSKDLIVQEQQIKTIEQLSGTTQQLVNAIEKLAMMQHRMDVKTQELEAVIKERVSVTAAQGKALSALVAARARALCDNYHLPYKLAGNIIRAALWRDFKRLFAISSVYDLPVVLFNEAENYIADYTSYSAMKSARAKVERYSL